MQTKKVLITDASCISGYGAFRTMYQDRNDLDFILFIKDVPENRILFDKFKSDVRVRMIWDDPAEESTIQSVVNNSNYILFVNDKNYNTKEESTISQNVQQIIKILEQKADVFQTRIIYIGEKPQLNPLISMTPFELSPLHKQSSIDNKDIDFSLNPMEKEERPIKKMKDKKSSKQYSNMFLWFIILIMSCIFIAKFMNNICIYCLVGDGE